MVSISNVSLNSSLASSGLFNSYDSTDTSTTPTIYPMDLSALMTSSSSYSTVKTLAKMVPWDSKAPKTDDDKLASATLSATSLFSGGLGKGAGSGITDKNDRELFLLYNAVNKLKALATVASSKSLNDSDKKRFNDKITKGLAEITAQANAAGLKGATLLTGKKYSSLASDALGNSNNTTFTTAPLVDGDATAIPEQFAGNVKFTIAVNDGSTNHNIAVDLSEMGATPRNVANVASYINGKLAAAGVETRFSRNEITKASSIKGVAAITQQGFKVTTGSVEKVTFTPDVSDSQTSVYVAGVKTVSSKTQSLISKIDVSPAGVTQNVSRTDFSATGGSANVRAMKSDAEGNVYTIADVSGEFNGLNAKSTSDVVLQKMDSTGRVVWTRALGSAAPAQGFSLAIDADGTVAVAGAVTGKIDNVSGFSGDGQDSFVSAFDAEGHDLWTHQAGALGDDKVKDIAFDGSGNLLVLGQTTNSISGSTIIGGTDVYVQSLDGSGNVNYSKSIGTSNNDTPIAIKTNGANAYVAWNSDTEGHVSRIDPTSGAFTAADVLTATNGIHKIAAFDLDSAGNAIIAGDNYNGTNTDAVADKLSSINLGTNTVNFTNNLAGYPVRALNVAGGTINIALEGVADEAAANPTALQSVLRGFSETTGAQQYSVAVQGENTGNISILTTPNQSASLKAMGLPKGDLEFDNTKLLSDLTGLRTGDTFYVSANGGNKRKITIADGETLNSLATKINNYTTSSASTTVLTKDGGQYLSMTPKTGNRVEFSAGAGTADALRELGIDAGVAMNIAAATKTKPAQQVVALDLPTNVDISDKAKAKTLADALEGVLGRIRIGYRAVSTDPAMVALRKQNASSSGKNSSNSAAIAAYAAQTAAMQNALAKLGG